MNISHLRYAVEVERSASITQAAENLFMGQPNLSKAIKELEASVGITIFKRTPKGVVPTKKGEEFLERAKMVLMQIDDMEALYSAPDEDSQTFAVAVPRATYIASAFINLASGLDMTRGMEVNFKETNSVDAINGVVEREFNIGIIRYQAAMEKYFNNLLIMRDLVAHTIWEFEYLLLLSRDNPLAKKKEINYEDLSGYVEISHGDISVPSMRASAGKDQTREGGKKKIYVYERGSQFSLLCDVPDTYMWVSPITDSMLEKYQLVQRRCRDETAKCKDVIIYPKGYRLSELDRQFVAEVTGIKDMLSKQSYN